VEGHNYLGIYLSKNSATVVCLSSQGRTPAVLDSFTVSLDQGQSTSAGMAQLAQLICDACAERVPSYRNSEVAVALDCGMFMQHSVHSEFTDAKQIGQTVRFDAEEALSTDISNVALAFTVASSAESGSQLTVFTAERQLLSEILLSLQNNGIDPITVEPDINCLARYIQQNISLSGDGNSIVGLLSRKRGYLVCLSQDRKMPTMRTFLIGTRQNRNELLARQIRLTMAATGLDEGVERLGIFDSAGALNSEQLGQRLGIETSYLDLAARLETESQVPDESQDQVAFAIACGAAAAHLEKASVANFRDDFMPFQGKKRRMEKTIKLLGVSVTLLLLAIGTYVTAQVMQTNKYRSRVYKRFKLDYLALAPKRNMPKKMSLGRKKLESIERGLKSQTRGFLSDDESAAAKLTLILDAFNKTAKPTKLTVKKINITQKLITIQGETRKRSETLRLKKTLASTLAIGRTTYTPQRNGRDRFLLTAVPKNSGTESTKPKVTSNRKSKRK